MIRACRNNYDNEAGAGRRTGSGAGRCRAVQGGAVERAALRSSSARRGTGIRRAQRQRAPAAGTVSHSPGRGCCCISRHTHCECFRARAPITATQGGRLLQRSFAPVAQHRMTAGLVRPPVPRCRVRTPFTLPPPSPTEYCPPHDLSVGRAISKEKRNKFQMRQK